MNPFVYELQRVIPLQAQLRNDFGLVPSVPLGVMNYIQPVLLTNLPSTPLDVNIVAPRPLDINLPLKEDTLSAAQDVPTSSASIPASGTRDFQIPFSTTLTDKAFLAWRFGFTLRHSSSLVQMMAVNFILNSTGGEEQIIHRGIMANHSDNFNSVIMTLIDRVVTGPPNFAQATLKARVYNKITTALPVSSIALCVSVAELK